MSVKTIQTKLSKSFDDIPLTPNSIEKAKLALEPSSFIDLTSSNPTQQGQIFPSQILEEASQGYWASRRYEADPRGSLAARQSIRGYYAEKRDFFAVPLEDIFITASTSEAYLVLFSLLCNPGDNILVSNVSYPLFEQFAALRQIELRPFNLLEEEQWQVDVSTLEYDAKTKAILFVSPHNPCGTILRQNIPLPPGLPVLIDEVFSEFLHTSSAIPSPDILFPHSPVFVLNGISKMFALPDLKLSWIVMNAEASKRYGGYLELANDILLGANSLTQSMLPSIMERGFSFVDSMRENIRCNVQMAIEILQQSSKIKVEMPEAGYYLFPRIDWPEGDEELVLYLLSHGVFVHPGYFYGFEDGCRIMLSCLTEKTELQAGLLRLVKALR